MCGGRALLANEAAAHRFCYLELVVSLSPSSWKSVVAGEDGRKRGELERVCVSV